MEGARVVRVSGGDRRPGTIVGGVGGQADD